MTYAMTRYYALGTQLYNFIHLRPHLGVFISELIIASNGGREWLQWFSISAANCKGGDGFETGFEFW